MVADPTGPGGFKSLHQAASWYWEWLTLDALPLWASAGVDPTTGAFREALTTQGEPVDPRRRTRVQARQVYVFASATADKVRPTGIEIARRGWSSFETTHTLPNGLYVSETDIELAATDPTPRLYEHAFVLLAMSALEVCGRTGIWSQKAAELQERLGAFRHAAGGFREAGAEPFQANAQMHLLEAALAWESVTDAACWPILADEIAELALRNFVDADSGVLWEFYDASWRPRRGVAGLIEPGHLFEWSWLLLRWGVARGESAALATARRLFDAGRRGYDQRHRVAVNALNDDLSIRDGGARLWAQTEHLQAALALGEDGIALEVANGLAAFLNTSRRGAWRERMRSSGEFIDEPAPATSLYHLYGAVRDLCVASLSGGEL